VSFSHERAGQQIRWEQSNRLTQGSMLALSTERDMFASICKMVIVAARPIVDGLDKDPPTIDLFFASVDDMAFDPAECKSAFTSTWLAADKSKRTSCLNLGPVISKLPAICSSRYKRLQRRGQCVYCRY